MVPVWLTVLVLAFGIAVAISGVAAYLRIYRKDRLAAATNETFSNSNTLKNDDSRVWKNKQNEHNIYVEKTAEPSSNNSDIQEKSEH